MPTVVSSAHASSTPFPSLSLSTSPSPASSSSPSGPSTLSAAATTSSFVSAADSRSDISPSAASALATSSNSSTRNAAHSGAATNNIEMEPIPGHRRRKSSLMNPVGGHSHPGIPIPGRPVTHHVRGQASLSLLEEPKEHAETSGRLGESGSSREGSGGDSSSDEDLQDDEEMGLTRKDRSRKQKKRRKNMLLDNRIVREKNLSPDEKKEADRNLVKNLFINGGLILLWYFFSLSISLVCILPISRPFLWSFFFFFGPLPSPPSIFCLEFDKTKRQKKKKRNTKLQRTT